MCAATCKVNEEDKYVNNVNHNIDICCPKFSQPAQLK